MAILLCWSFQSIAATPMPALDFDSLGAGFNFYQGQYSLGWRFTANENITVSALGFYDDLKNGLSDSHQVGIYDQQTCTLITSTTVETSDPLTGFFRYHDIKPVVLPSGRDYYIAALTNGLDKYALNVSDLVLHPAISFWGFAVYGNTQTTSTLECPNGSAAQQGFKGDFGPGFLISETSGNSEKRATAVKLFCNRSGPSLETATCSATVSDIGAPPRTLPTGSIEFVAVDGFLPETASCNPTQTAFSPGVGACEAVFQIPAGFPIGAKFPIEARYTGNEQFELSATSHELIQAGCIGDESNFCSGSASLGFSKLPENTDSVIELIAGCSSSKTILAKTPLAEIESALAKEPGLCSIKVFSNAEVAKALSELSAEAFATLDDVVSDYPRPKDKNVRAAHELIHQVQSKAIDWTLLKNDPDEVEAKLIELRDKKILKPKPTQQKSALLARPPKPYIVKLGSKQLQVKSNRQKNLKLKMPKDSFRLLQAMKQAGVEQLDVSMTLSSKRMGRLPTGIDRKESVEKVTSIWLR